MGPIKTTDPVPAEIVQIGIDDGGNPRPLFVVAKNLTVANYGDILAALRIDNIAMEHIFLFCVSDVSLQLRIPPRCSGCRAIFRGCREMARSLCQMSALRRSRLSASRASGAGATPWQGSSTSTADAKLTELLVTLANCPRSHSLSIYDTVQGGLRGACGALGASRNIRSEPTLVGVN